jgi:hypothetical protein
MDTPEFEEGWFKNPENGLELSVQYDGTNIFVTFFDLDKKPAGKKVIKVEDASLPEIQSLFDEYKKVD